MLSRMLSTTMLALFVVASTPGGAVAQTMASDSLLVVPALDLRLLERAALENNPSLGAMRAAWQGAEAAADQAGAPEDPMLEVTSAPRSWAGGGRDPAYMAGISQRLPLFGQTALKARAAHAGARALGEDYRSARLDILREVRRAYYETFLASRARAVNADLKDLLGQIRRTAVARYSAGTAGLEDALQADVEIAMLDHEDVMRAREMRVAGARLNALLRRDPGSYLPAPPADLPLPPAPMRADSLRSLAYELRPELKGYAARRASKAAELSLARRERVPEFTLTARYDRFMEEPSWRSQVGLALRLPLWLGKLASVERAARAGVDEMEFRKASAAAQIGAEVEVALAGAQETEHEIHIIRERVVPATERALRAVRASYENSRASFAALLNAERDLARARLDLSRAQVGFLMAMADLDRAVGSAPAGEEETR